jgi:hypothetical protein
MTSPSGRISNEPEERKREKKMPFIVATYVYASSQVQRTHSARTNSFTLEDLFLQVQIEWDNDVEERLAIKR